MSKILVIDDDALNFQIYATKLRGENHEVEFCDNSEKALEKIQEKYDLIILDVMIPKIDGLQLLSEIQKGVNKNSIVLIFTNLLSDKTKEACLAGGAKEYLTKADYTPGLLVEKIKGYLTPNKTN